MTAGALVNRWPRLAAALCFGVAGSALPAAWFLPTVLSRWDPIALALFIGLPGVAAATAGAVVGAAICDPLKRITSQGAILRGAGVATLAFVIFAPMFSVLFAHTSPGRTNILGLALTVLIFSAVAIWWLAAAVGGVVGWLLHRCRSDLPRTTI
jgi:hypothetical protein